jgi:hypothetical protein
MPTVQKCYKQNSLWSIDIELEEHHGNKPDLHYGRKSG